MCSMVNFKLIYDYAVILVGRGRYGNTFINKLSVKLLMQMSADFLAAC